MSYPYRESSRAPLPHARLDIPTKWDFSVSDVVAEGQAGTTQQTSSATSAAKADTKTAGDTTGNTGSK